MKSRFSLFVLICCALLVPVAYAFTATPDQAAETVRWEHLALQHERADLGGGLGKQINRLGNEGWQLVDVMPVAKDGTTEKSIYYFKRPK